MFDSARPEDIVAFLKNNSPSSLTGRTPREAWKHYLAVTLSQAGTLGDLEKAFLSSKGATGATIHDQLTKYLSAKGYTGSSPRDRMRNFTRNCVTP
jgi:hypothetical protein